MYDRPDTLFVPIHPTRLADVVSICTALLPPGDRTGLAFTSAARLAGAMGVPTNRITAILNGTRGVSGETALLLGKVFGTTPEFWMNLQIRYELDLAVSQTAAARLDAAEAFGRTLLVSD